MAGRRLITVYDGDDEQVWMKKGRQDEIHVVTWSPILCFILEATKAKDEEGEIKITELFFPTK